MMLRFDAKQTLASQPYFYVNLVSYIMGLGLTVSVMHFFDSAQPALLYLVPACILSSLITAVARGELKPLLTFSEEKKEEKSVDDKKARRVRRRTSHHTVRGMLQCRLQRILREL